MSVARGLLGYPFVKSMRGRFACCGVVVLYGSTAEGRDGRS
jgi:hypothetical protein